MTDHHSIEVAQLQVGMFVHLDLGWWAHPFTLSSFQIACPDEIKTIQGLGLKRLRWSPEKSRMPAAAAAAPEPTTPPPALCTPAAPPVDPATQAATLRRAELAAQQAAARLCQRQYSEAATAWQQAAAQVLAQPQQARLITEGLTQGLLDKMLVDDELCIRMLADQGGDRATSHALNVSILSLLMGRACGLDAAELQDLGVGALLHDIGKLELPERLRHSEHLSAKAEVNSYREHVGRGVKQAQRMGLSLAAAQVIAQHHEMADGSGFPLALAGERIALAARIVALINRYDNLCNAGSPAQALTPHEALSLMFAQCRNRFDPTILNAFIKLLGVYPPGSVVQLTDERYALVMHVNAARPLKPRVLVHDPHVAAADALLLNLEQQADLGIRRSLKPAQLPSGVHEYLAPRQRVSYFFEPAPLQHLAPASLQAA